MHAEYRKALDDIVEGATHWQMWGRLGWQEVRRRYRRTIIGPFWTTLSLGIFIVSLGVVWARLWNQPIATYLPFVSAGLITWTLVSALITEGCTAFQANEGIVKQIQISFTLLVCSIVWRNLIVFFHNLVIFVALVAIFRLPLTPATLLVVPGLALVCVNGAWIGMICGMACARYRDLQPLIGSILQVAIFVTPIFFLPDQLGRTRVLFAGLNPLFHLIDIVRAPLLGNPPHPESWVAAVLIAIVGWGVAIFLFARFRRRLAFWL